MSNRNQSGMTLVELLIAIIMFGIIITGVYSLFRVHNLMAAKQEETTLMQQELLAAMVQISEDLRMCGYSPAKGDFGFVATDDDGRGTNATSVYCTKDVSNENGIVDDDAENATDEHAAYRLNITDAGVALGSPDNVLKRYIPSTNATKWQQVATNISDLQFVYLDSDGNEILNPTTNAASIRTVQITATAIPSTKRSNMGIGSRTMTTSVHCRNIGF